MPRHSLFFTYFASIAACYTDPATVVILCPPEASQCPSGQSCKGGLCQPDPSDMAGGVPLTDLAGSDAAAVDMVSSGCAQGGGTPIGKAYGCKKVFAAGEAKSVCAPQWAPCVSASGIDQAQCKTTSGYYAAEQPAYWIGTMAAETCGTSIGNQVLYGCGAAGRTGTAKCGGLPVVIDVGVGGWASPNGTLASSSNSDPNQGVLCCPP